MQPTTTISELRWEDHNDRQRYEVGLQGLNERGEKLKASNKFKNVDGVWQPQEYKGYAIVSMLDANPGNEPLSENLVGLQQQLATSMQLPRQLYMMPKASFHQTMVNTLSGYRFQAHIMDKGLEKEYPEIIKNAMDKARPSPLSAPMQMHFSGIGIFGSAFGVLGMFQNSAYWNTVMQLRQDMYGNPTLHQYDIKRTRPFIAHITLGYIDGELSPQHKQHFVEQLHEINTATPFSDFVFHIANTQLRSYDHLAEFVYKRNYPSYKFCGHAT
ncbi:MAG: hypothetical protein AAGL34_08310 [Bacteroidota bacterium]